MFRQDHTKWTKMIIGVLLLIGGVAAAFSRELSIKGSQLATGQQAFAAGAIIALAGLAVIVWTWKTEF